MVKDLAQLIIRATDQTGAAFDSASRNVQNLSGGVSELNGLLAGIGVSLSAGAFATLIKQSVDAQAALDDLADSTALTVETLSSLQQTARIGGHSFEMVTGTASKFAKSVAEAAGGNKELLRSFDALGISQERLRTAKFDDLYTEFATKIAKAENKTYAIAYATDLAGKSAAQALPFFKDLADTGLEQARVTTQQAEAADRLQKQIGRLGNEFDGFKNRIASAVVPALTSLIEEMNEGIRIAGGFGNALRLLGTINPFRTPGENIAEMNRQIEALEKNRERNLSRGLGTAGLDARLEELRTQKSFSQFQQRNQALRGAEALGTGDVWSRRLASDSRGFDLPPPPSSGGATDSAGRQLISSLKEQIAQLEGGGDNAFDKAIRQLEDSTKKFTAAEREAITELSRKGKALVETKAAIDAAVAAYDRAEATQRAADKVLADFNQTQSETLQNLQFETELLRLNDVEREQAIALRKLENEYRKATIRLEGEEMEAYAERMRQTRAIYEANKDALPGMVRSNVEGRQLIEAQKRAADESRRVWERFHDDIGRGLTDALMRGFENGKSFGENFWESLKNTANTTILRPIVQFAVSPITGAITAAMGGVMPGTAGASTGGAGGGGNLLGSLFGGNPMGWITNSAGSGGGIMGGINALSLGADALFQSAGVGMGSQLIADIGNFGFGVPAMGAITNLMMGNVKGAVGSAALGTIGTMIGGPLGGMIGSAVGSMIGGKKKAPATFTGYNLSGTVGAGGISGMLYGTATGGSGNTSWAHTDLATAYGGAFGGYNDQVLKLIDQVRGIAGRLGYSASGPVSASYSLSGVSDAQIASGEAITLAMEQVTEQISRQLIPNFAQLARAGETAAVTLARLTSEAQQASLGRMQAALGLADNTRDLWLSDLSPLSPEARLKEAGLRYNETLTLARGGDANAIAGLSGMSRSYLEQARGYYASGTGYADIFSQVQGDVRGLVNDTLVDQAIAFADIAGSLENVADLLGNVDKRIANQLEAVFKARDIADEVYKKAILQQNAELISQVRDLTQQLARVAA